MDLITLGLLAGGVYLFSKSKSSDESTKQTSMENPVTTAIVGGAPSGTIVKPGQPISSLPGIQLGAELLPGIQVSDPSIITLDNIDSISAFQATSIKDQVQQMIVAGKTESEIEQGLQNRVNVALTGSYENSGYVPASAIATLRDGRQVLLYPGDTIPSNIFQLETNPEGLLPWVGENMPGYFINFDSAYSGSNPPNVKDILTGLGLRV